MNKIGVTLRYLLKSALPGIGVGLLSVLGIVAVTDWIHYLNSQHSLYSPQESLLAPVEVAGTAFCLLIGAVLFIPNFKVALANGITRKIFFLANLLSAVIIAAIFAIFDLFVIRTHSLFLKIHSFSEWNYPQTGWVWFLLWHFSYYLTLLMTGRLILLALYRSSTPLRWAISLSPLWGFCLVWFLNSLLDDSVIRLLSEYNRWSRSFPQAVPVLLVYAAIAAGLIYLLLRRAPVKSEGE